MALIKCTECGKEISDRAESCPNCAYPIVKLNKTHTIERRETHDINVQRHMNSSIESDSSKALEEELRIREEQRRKRREAARIKKQRARRRKIIIISCIAAVLIIGIAVLFISHFFSDKFASENSNPEPVVSDNTPTSNSSQSIAAEVYSDLVDYVSQNGIPYTTSADINNPNQVKYYIWETEKEIDNFPYTLEINAYPPDEGTTTFTFVLYKKLTMPLHRIGYSMSSEDYKRFSYQVTLEFDTATGLIDLTWREDLYTLPNKFDIWGSFSGNGAQGKIHDIIVSDYSDNMVFPDIVEFTAESWSQVSRDTARKDIIAFARLAINELILTLQDFGLDPIKFGFTNEAIANAQSGADTTALKGIKKYYLETARIYAYMANVEEQSGSNLIDVVYENRCNKDGVGFEYYVIPYDSDFVLLEKAIRGTDDAIVKSLELGGENDGGIIIPKETKHAVVIISKIEFEDGTTWEFEYIDQLIEGYERYERNLWGSDPLLTPLKFVS